MALGHEWGLVGDAELARHRASDERVRREVERLASVRHDGVLAATLLCRPGVEYEDVARLTGPAREALSAGEVARVVTLVRYAAYIDRANRQLGGRAAYERMSLDGVDLERVASLSNEGRAALRRAAPATLGAAQRVRGVRDSDVTALLVHLKGHHHVAAEGASG